MKKILLSVILLFIFFSILPGKVNAIECCPPAYTYDNTTNRCYITSPGGRYYEDSNCTSSQVCENNECVTYQEPTTSTGCSAYASSGKFCTKVTGGHGSISIYCSTTAECESYIGKLPTTEKVEKVFPTCSTNSGKGIDTAIGCIPIENSNALIGFILRWAIGIGGGVAFLLIIVAGFQITTSAGNPDKVKAGQELMTSAIAGLLLLIFSVFVLNIIGVDILGLPGFGK